MSAPGEAHPLAGSRIAIVGSGAMGCYYGARLAAAGCDVHFLMRSGLEHVRTHGLTVRSHLGDILLPQVQAWATAAECGPVDLVLITLKTTGNAALEQLVPPLLREDTVLLTLQNGLGNEEYLASRWGAARVMGGVAFTCINRLSPGVIEHTAQGNIAIGAYAPDLARQGMVLRIAAGFNASGVECRVVDSLAAVRWRKLVWNIPFNGLAILGGGIDTERILQDPALAARVGPLMEEVIAAAAALGHPMPAGLVENQFEVTRKVGAYRPSSMLDYLAGAPVEVEAIWGEPLRAAARAGVPTPRLDMLYHLLRSLCQV